MSNNKSLKNKNEKGFTLLFAVLVSTLVLAVGASIISMAIRQTILSGIGRDSQFAFYAANTGVECGIYYDRLDSYNFATSTDSSVDSGDIFCANNTLKEADGDVTKTEEGDTYATTKFRLFFKDIGDNEEIRDDDLEYCVDVYVEKFAVDDDGNPVSNIGDAERYATKVLARGYNTCDTDNARRIERGLEIEY